VLDDDCQTGHGRANLPVRHRRRGSALPAVVGEKSFVQHGKPLLRHIQTFTDGKGRCIRRNHPFTRAKMPLASCLKWFSDGKKSFARFKVRFTTRAESFSPLNRSFTGRKMPFTARKNPFLRLKSRFAFGISGRLHAGLLTFSAKLG